MTTPPKRWLPLSICASLAVFVAAWAWGVFFGFPAPDAAPEAAARLRFHAGVSGWLMLAALLALAASCVALVRQRLRARRQAVD
jgi:hypothetical protein